MPRTVKLASLQSSPRIDPRLLRALPALDDPRDSIAETRRRLGDFAASLDLPRPSYERVRQLVHEHRHLRSDSSRVEALLDLAFYTRPPEEVLAELLIGEKRHLG